MGRLANLVGIGLFLLLVSAPAVVAVEFAPFPEARITAEQWEAYYDDVRQSFGATERKFPDLKLVTYDDAAGGAAVMCFTSTSIDESPLNGTSPVMTWKMSVPNA